MRVHINIAKARELGLPIPEGAQMLIEYEVTSAGEPHPGWHLECAVCSGSQLARRAGHEPCTRFVKVCERAMDRLKADAELVNNHKVEIACLEGEMATLKQRLEESEALRLEQLGLAAAESAELRAQVDTLTQPSTPPTAPPEPKEPAEPVRKQGKRP